MKELKLIFAGLDNAGKTSFLIALRKKYNFYERVKQLKPTIKIAYSSFNFLDRFMINFWDMGGQAKYRKIYLDKTVYFSNTDFLYYLIDIKDDLRFQDSVKYLHELLDIFRDKKMQYTNEIIICFNKYDPEYRISQEYKDNVEMLKKLILTQNKDLKFKFFNTTYYDISSLSKAVSYSLNKLLNLEKINKKLKKIVDTYNCSYAILFSETGLMISDYYKNIIDFRDFDKKVCRVNESLEFFQRLVDEDVGVDEKLTFSENRIEYVKKYETNNENEKLTFYLGICTPSNNIDSIKSELMNFQEDLKSI